MKNIAIFCNNSRTGSNFLLKLVSEIGHDNIKRSSVVNSTLYRIEMIDGSVYRVFPEIDLSRGWKWDKAYVQRGLLDNEELYYRLKAGCSSGFDVEIFG